MDNRKRNRKGRFVALGLSVALLGVVFGVALTANLSETTDARAESLTQMALSASTSDELESPFKTVYQEASPSVVGVKVTMNMRVSGGRIRTDTQFVGSGVSIGDGYVITNYHVATAGGTLQAGSTTLTVVYEDTDYPATYVAGDESSDIAVLKVEGLNAPAAKIGNSDALTIGDWALVIGNPLGEQFTNTLTVGVISGMNRSVQSNSRIGSGTSDSLIQTSAQINSGNSGGGLFNIKGELVGITSAKMSSSYYSSTSIEGIGFAIPINTVTKIVDDLIEYGKVLTPRFGIKVTTLSSDVDEPTKDSLPKSVWVHEVEKDSPAEAAGMQVNDFIMEVAGQRVTSSEELQKVLKQQTVGEFVDVVVYRVPGASLMQEDADLSQGEMITLKVEVKLLDAA